MSTLDNGYYKYIGWGETINDRQNYHELWSPNQLQIISDKITQLLQGVHPENRSIIVPYNTIGNVMSQVYETNRPKVGDIYSRYQQGQTELQRNDVRDIIDRTIEIIVSQIRNEYQMIEQNNKLTVWNSLYGDFNPNGLRAHPPIKLRKRGPNRFQFHMNY